MNLTKTEFLKTLILWAICFFGIGQWLFGCGPSKAQLKAWSEVERVTAIQQGLTDRAVLGAGNKQGLEDKDEGKITILPVPDELPTIITTTVTPGKPQYIDELGEVAEEDRTVTETRVDTTALAIQQLGKIALALAERTGSPVLPKMKKTDATARVAYQRHPMPQSNAPEVIKNVGSAIKESGVVTGIVSGFLGWVAGSTVQEVAKVPSHDGDYVQLQDSYNPTTTNIEEIAE